MKQNRPNPIRIPLAASSSRDKRAPTPGWTNPRMRQKRSRKGTSLATIEPSNRSELLSLCGAFVGNQGAPPQILDALRRFVTTEPKALTCQPLFRADEIEERKVIGGTLQTMIESHNTLENVVGPVFWSLIMTAPIHRLRSWVQDECKPDRVNYAYTATIDLGHLLKTCRFQCSQPPAPHSAMCSHWL